MARPRRDDPIVDLVLGHLVRQDGLGKLEPSELTDEIERLAAYRKISPRTLWERWQKMRHPDIGAMIA